MPALRVTPVPADANLHGDIFGGWIMSQVDIAAGIVAAARARGRVGTVAVNAFQFHQPVFVGDVLSIYADVVRVLYGYDVKCQCIIGIGVVSMRETPGIGDKIITDQAFLKNFEALDVRVNTELTALSNAVKTVKHGTKQNAWEIDAIAGATITSKAVGRGINESAQALLPKLVSHSGELQP